MDIAPDPKSDIVDDSDDGFDADFAAFAAGKTPAPPEAKSEEDDKSDGNGPEEKAATPAEEKSGAEVKVDPKEAATSDDDAKPDGGDPAPKADDKQAPDPWANADPTLKEAYEALKRERDEAAHRASSDAARVAALSRKVRELSTSPAAAPVAAAPTEAEKALNAKIAKLKEDYGDIAEPLLALLEQQKSELTTVRTQLHGLGEQQQRQVIEHETQVLDAKHPDWRAIAQSPEFVGWMEIQPENIQRLATSWDARETSVALTLYKMERGEATGQKQEAPSQEKKAEPDPATGAKRSQQLEGGRDIRSKPAPAASGPPEDFDAAFEHFVEKRRAAQR